MSVCERLEQCIFFSRKMKDMPAEADQLKEKYCLHDNSHCARYLILKELGKEKVPYDLFPNQRRRALKILSS